MPFGLSAGYFMESDKNCDSVLVCTNSGRAAANIIAEKAYGKMRHERNKTYGFHATGQIF
jgi:hypothetical protein